MKDHVVEKVLEPRDKAKANKKKQKTSRELLRRNEGLL